MENKIITEEMWKNRKVNTIYDLCERYNLTMQDFGCLLKMYEYEGLTHKCTLEEIIDNIDTYFKLDYITEHDFDNQKIFIHIDNEIEIGVIVDTEVLISKEKIYEILGCTELLNERGEKDV